MKEYLFIFTITPVQGFIEQSRKTQDLYAGSVLLSFLCRQADTIIQKEWHGEIVFPDVNLRSLPNRLLAIVKSDNESKLKEKGFELEQKIYAKLDEVFDSFFQFYGIPKPSGAWKQIRTYFHLYWIFHPVDAGYAQAYKEIESYLGQIKIRAFLPLHEEGGRKCTLTGEHNALFYRKNTEGSNPAGLDKVKTEKIEFDKRIPLKYMAPGEALGAVGFLKRVAPKYFEDHKVEGLPYGSSFPSTASIAVAHVLDELSRNCQDISDLLKEEFNEELIYVFYSKPKLVENMTEEDRKTVKRITEYEREKELEIAKQIYKKIKDNRYRLTPYYAVLIFDGDDMGKWLSGEKLKEEKKEQLREFHRHLSKELAEFARTAAENILVAPKGATVYAGGDDFLGFVNLIYLPSILKVLREEFGKIDLSEFTDEKLTFSAGVVVSHYRTPLTEVLQWARHMEKEAKALAGKDALSIAVLRRSGEITKFRTKLYNSQGWFADQLQFLLKKLDNHFTTNFINQFCTEFIPFEGNMEVVNLDGMIESELGRLLNRSYVKQQSASNPDSENKLKDQIVADMKKVLNNLYLESNLTDFLGLLDTISFLAREVKVHVDKQ